MGNLSKKLFKKTQSVPIDKAKKIGAQAYKQRAIEEGSRIYAEVLTCLLVYMHNDFGLDKPLLLKILKGVDEFMRSIKNFNGDVIAEARKVLKEECDLDMVIEYKKLMELERKGD